MTTKPTFSTYFMLAAAFFSPRYWAKWFITCFVLMIAFFFALDSAADHPDATAGNGYEPGVHMTPLSWVFGIAFLVNATVGFVHCWRLTGKHNRTGVPAKDASLFQHMTGWNVAPEAPAEPLESPESHDNVLVVPTVLATGKARQSELHEGFVVNDRRPVEP